MKAENIFFIIMALLLSSLVIYLFWAISENGRMLRDLQGSGISDNEVKGLWCGFLDFPNGYSKIDGKEYCGDVEVEVDCIFTNMGDHCIIKEINKRSKGE